VTQWLAFPIIVIGGMPHMLMTIRCDVCQTESQREINVPDDPLKHFGVYAKCQTCKSLLTFTKERADFSFGSVANLAREYLITPDCAALKRVTEAFTANLDHVLVLGRLPEFLVFQSEFSRGLSPHNDIERAEQKDPPPPGSPQRLYYIEHNVHFDPELFFKIIPTRGAYLAVEGLLSSMVLGTWTAFETLAGDLWDEALNVAPKRLAMLGGDARRIEQKTGSRMKKRQDPVAQANEAAEGENEDEIPDRAVSLKLMHRLSGGKFNLSRSMGTLQREELEFDSLKGIRAAYSRAFYKPISADIDESLSDRHLDAVQLVRNLLAHRAGIADQTYEDRAKKLPVIPRLKKNERLNLTGALVADLMKPVIQMSIRLISGVDKRACAEVAKNG
jgi:hypothetical protein